MDKSINWIPQEKELVKWRDKLYVVLSVNLGGKCKIKQFTLSKRMSRVFTDIDVSELSRVKNIKNEI